MDGGKGKLPAARSGFLRQLVRTRWIAIRFLSFRWIAIRFDAAERGGNARKRKCIPAYPRRALLASAPKSRKIRLTIAPLAVY